MFQETSSILRIGAATSRLIIPSMSWWVQRVLKGRLLRKAWVVAAILAALFAGMVGFDKSADASSYYPE